MAKFSRENLDESLGYSLNLFDFPLWNFCAIQYSYLATLLVTLKYNCDA